jgi:pimeloyl-ACP methyl ester carboxylesterase
MTSRVEQEAVLPALAGDRLPVLALHGAAGSSRQWQSLADHLGDNCTVIAPDLPGYGTAGSQSVRDAAETAERIIGLMAIDGEPMHIVGHSIGAAIALEIAMSRPDLVRSLTLIEPAVFHLLRGGGAPDQALFVELSDLAERMARSVEAGDAAGATRAYVDYFCGGGTWDRSGPGPRGGFARQARCVSASLAATLRATWPLTRLNMLQRPTRVLMALESPAASLRVTEMVAEALPRARLTMIPGAGHMALLTDPLMVSPLVAEHLKRCDLFRTRRSSWPQAA